jgi:hypothetical protein
VVVTFIKRRALRATLALVFVCAFVTACGGSHQGGPTVSSPFEPRDAQLFDDGMDLMEDPDSLHGQWRADWEHELTERIERSDVVVEGEVVAVHADTDPDKRTSHRVVLSVGRVHRGHMPAGETSLVAREGALGFRSIAGKPERLLRRQFVAFIKYAEAPGRPIAHFHLTPPSVALRRGFEAGNKSKTVHVVRSKEES